MEIVLIDDDNGSRKSIEMLLTDLNYKVYDFENALSALQFMETHPVSVVLSDIRMPKMTGLELLETLLNKQSYHEVAVILFTGQSNVQDAVKALKIGAFDYLAKPLNFEEMINTIEKAFEYINLKKENKDLKQNFKKQVDAVTFSIKKDVTNLKHILKNYLGFNQIGVFSKSLEKVFEHAQVLHQNPEIPVLIQGETGTGKEVIAKFIHFGKELSSKPFIGVNAATIPNDLFESELFGYEGGAFTGSKIKGTKGKISAVEDGSLFLDEITSLNTGVQAKLLRVIQEKEYFKVGSNKPVSTSARFIFASNENINDLVNQNRFRKDLYYRLKSGFILIPPLRDRKEEILPLAEMFLTQIAREKNRLFSKIHSSAKKILEEYHWPGNVRELKSSIERVIILYNETELKDYHLAFLYEDSVSSLISNNKTIINTMLNEKQIDLENLTLQLVQSALIKHHGNKTKTAEFLKITRNQLYTYLEKINM